MTTATPLPSPRIADALADLPGWKFDADAGCLTKTYTFNHFREAISFLVRVAFEAERVQHHPEIHNVYRTVDLILCTHDAGNKVTQKDIDLALAIEKFNWV
ncbi:MAG: 4a-hydroxytetrahydrobiopterin dehydratase [Phycisphaeraceae bacterium]|nr:4a-hydroxytetrahydrobiopterin dehydratase [Phycisphaeraceae bacterium]